IAVHRLNSRKKILLSPLADSEFPKTLSSHQPFSGCRRAPFFIDKGKRLYSFFASDQESLALFFFYQFEIVGEVHGFIYVPVFPFFQGICRHFVGYDLNTRTFPILVTSSVQGKYNQMVFVVARFYPAHPVDGRLVVELYWGPCLGWIFRPYKIMYGAGLFCI